MLQALGEEAGDPRVDAYMILVFANDTNMRRLWLPQGHFSSTLNACGPMILSSENPSPYKSVENFNKKNNISIHGRELITAVYTTTEFQRPGATC